MARSRRRRARALKVFGFLALLTAGATVGVRRLASSEEPAYRYVTAPVRVGDLREVVTATGTLKGLDSVDVGAQISGRVLRVHVDVNDEVKVGQVLAELDPAQLRSRVEQARAQVRAADASVRLARATAAQNQAQIARVRDLNQQGLVSSKDLEAAEADFERSGATVASAEAQATLSRASLKDAETSLSYGTILAPIDGIVLARMVEPGQTVAASLQSPVLFTLARDLTQLELRVDIDEADVGRVKKDQVASFVVDAWPTHTFASRVVNVHNLPTAGQTVVTYQGVLAVDNRDLRLRPGMTATATIVTSERKGVLLIPNSALRFRPPVAPSNSASGPALPIMPMRGRFGANRGRAPEKTGGRTEETVFLLKDGQPSPLKVEVGGTDGRVTEVTKGDVRANTPVIVDAEEAKNP